MTLTAKSTHYSSERTDLIQINMLLEEIFDMDFQESLYEDDKVFSITVDVNEMSQDQARCLKAIFQYTSVELITLNFNTASLDEVKELKVKFPNELNSFSF